MLRNVHEILEDVSKANTWEEKIQILKQNNSPLLRDILYGAFSPNVEFFLSEIPSTYKANNCPIGMGETNLAMESKLFHYLMKSDPTPHKKKVQMLLSMLEALEEREANVVINMIHKDMSEYGLRSAHVKEAFSDMRL